MFVRNGSALCATSVEPHNLKKVRPSSTATRERKGSACAVPDETRNLVQPLLTYLAETKVVLEPRARASAQSAKLHCHTEQSVSLLTNSGCSSGFDFFDELAQLKLSNVFNVF